jgi:hypothetical protein
MIESNKDHLVILFNVVQATIVWHKGGNLLPVFNKMNLSTLSNGRVRLLGFYDNFLKNNAYCTGRSSKWLLSFISKM